jgi:hypothetical protein
MPGPARELSFSNWDEVVAEVDRLHQGGYTKTGNWNLAQTLNHLNYFLTGPLDGHQFKCPWIFKALFGRWALKRILSGKKMKPGIFTPQKPLPQPGGDEASAVAQFRETAQRFKNHPGPWIASPFFGNLTPEQWHKLQLIHCGHHLGYLVGK